MDQQNYEMNQREQKKEKSHKMAYGVIIGILATLLVGWTGINVACFATNSQILITSRGAAGTSDAIPNAVANQSVGEILDEETVDKISELAAYTSLYYYDEVDIQAMQDGLYAGLLKGIGDPYSVYYNAEEYQSLQVNTTGKYYGIGAGLTQDTDTMVVTINRIYEGTPSEAAGLKEEDIIISVDDVEATSMEVTDLVQLIRGEIGTTVHIEAYRPATGEELSFDVERADITLPSISHEMMENNIGYIMIDAFETETASQFEAAVADLENQGMQALILDVRYNPGGMVTSVVEILDDILPEGTVVYIEDKNGNRQDYTSKGNTYLDYPIAVLINEDSASAAEILAGAIKDYEYGTLIGTTTFGKGIVQTIFPLEDGDAVKLTTAKYFTPNGNYIHGVGIEPDIELEYEYLDPEGERYESAYDNQILKALEVLKGQLGD